jgi:hypothetical protein
LTTAFGQLPLSLFFDILRDFFIVQLLRAFSFWFCLERHYGFQRSFAGDGVKCFNGYFRTVNDDGRVLLVIVRIGSITTLTFTA